MLSLEKLDGPLMLLSRGTRLKSAEISPAPGLRIDFARIESIFTCFELPNHGVANLRGDERLPAGPTVNSEH